MAKIPKTYKSFQSGMSSFPNSDGIARLEHFDVFNDQLKPYRGLQASVDDVETYDKIFRIIKANNVTSATAGSNLFAIANNYGVSRFAIMEWDITTQKWSVFKSSGADSTYAEVFHYYGGKFIGLTNGTHLWTVTKAAVDLAAVALSYTSADVDFITHSKDNLVYIATDNKVSVYNGTTISTGVTLASTFLITSIAERGDYIMIVGYDSVTGRSTAYLWDRDTTLTVLTGKYELGNYQVKHNATLGGTDFAVSTTWESSNTSFNDEKSLVVSYLNQDKFKVLDKYRFTSITLGDKYLDGDNLYFTAAVKFLNETATHYLLFRLNDKGRLFIEQNLSVNDTAGYAINGFIKDGDGFWFGHSNTDSIASCGYHTKEAYDATSIVELNGHKADNEAMNLDVVGGAVTFDPLPAAGVATVKTKADNETSWTTVATFNTDNSLKGTFVNLDISTAKKRYWRIESTGGAVLNSFQVVYEEKADEVYD